MTEEGLLHGSVSFGDDENAWGLDSEGSCVALNAHHTTGGDFSEQCDS